MLDEYGILLFQSLVGVLPPPLLELSGGRFRLRPQNGGTMFPYSEFYLSFPEH